MNSQVIQGVMQGQLLLLLKEKVLTKLLACSFCLVAPIIHLQFSVDIGHTICKSMSTIYRKIFQD